MKTIRDLVPEQVAARLQENRHGIAAAAIAAIQGIAEETIPGRIEAISTHLAAQAHANEIAEYLECVAERMLRIESPSRGSVANLADKARLIESLHLARLDSLTSI
jgi:hypothetical protein